MAAYTTTLWLRCAFFARKPPLGTTPVTPVPNYYLIGLNSGFLNAEKRSVDISFAIVERQNGSTWEFMDNQQLAADLRGLAPTADAIALSCRPQLFR